MDSDNQFLPATVSNTMRPARADVASPVIVESVSNADQGGPASAQRAFNPRLLLAYRWSILACFLGLGTLAVAGVWLALAPQYTATAKIEISPIVPQLLHEGKTDMFAPYESYRLSQVDHVTGMEVLQAVLGHDNIRATKWYRGTPATTIDRWLSRLGIREKAPPLDRLAQAVTADAPRGKQHIYVSMGTHFPGEAKLIIDAVIEEYARFANRRDSDSELERITAIRNEIRTRERDESALHDRAAELRGRLGSGSPERLVEQRLLRVDELISQLRSVQAKYAIKTQAATTQQAGSAASQPAIASGHAVFEADREWQRLNEELVTARRNLGSASTQYGELHPVISKLRKLVDYTEAQIKAREAELATGSAPAVVAAKDESVHELALELEVLKQTAAQEQEVFDRTFRDAEALIKLNNSSAELAGTLEKLRSELERIEMNRQVAGRIQTWAAYEPSVPDKDRRWKLTAAALFGSLAASVALAFLRIKTSPTVDAVGEVPSFVEPFFLGRLPLRHDADPAAIVECPVVGESVRMLRTALLNRLERGQRNAIQVTSATPGSGKSTLAVLLARSFAQLGKRVLLIDADVRRPSLAAHFAVAPSPGLVDVLVARGSSATAICATPIAKLSVLPAGQPARPTDRELLANGIFSGLLDQWRQQYDLVLLDSSPLLDAADAAIISRQVDGTILVVRERHCRRAAVVEALGAMEAAGGKLVGTVFVGGGSAGAYGYGYGYGYEPTAVSGANQVDSAAGVGPDDVNNRGSD